MFFRAAKMNLKTPNNADKVRRNVAGPKKT